MTGNGSPRVIHLAAGEGTRLRPITDDRPKPLVELGGTSLLERNVETLRECGVTDQLVVTGYRADEIRSLGYETVHNPVYDETDMVYSLFCAEEAFPSDRDLILSYGDIVYENRVVSALLRCDSPICVVVDRAWRQLWELRFDDPLEDAETLSIGEDGTIEEIGGDPNDFDEIEGQYIGLIKIRADCLGRFSDEHRSIGGSDADTYTSIEMTHFLQRLIDKGWEVRSVPIERGWLEVDTTEELMEYRERHARGELTDQIDL